MLSAVAFLLSTFYFLLSTFWFLMSAVTACCPIPCLMSICCPLSTVHIEEQIVLQKLWDTTFKGIITTMIYNVRSINFFTVLHQSNISILLRIQMLSNTILAVMFVLGVITTFLYLHKVKSGWNTQRGQTLKAFDNVYKHSDVDLERYQCQWELKT